MNQPLFIFTVGAGLIAAIVLVVKILLDRRRSTLSDRLDVYDDEVLETVDQAILSAPFSERFVLPLLNWMGRQFARLAPHNDITMLGELIDRSGRASGWTAQTIYALQFVLAIVFAAIAGTAGWLAQAGGGMAVVWGVMGFVLGVMFPRTNLKRRVRARQHELEREMPDLLDLITVTVEAGLGFEAGLRKVIARLDNDLTGEIKRALSAYDLGVPLSDALLERADQLQIRPLQTLVRMINQSEQTGTGIAVMVRQQADDLRRKRRFRAQELGQKAPVKMLFPMVGCIFPTIFLMLLGPAAVKLLGHH